jgi:hypothetical protein
MDVQPFENNVFFQFVDDTTNTKFANSTTAGILIAHSSNAQSDIPRWGKITHIGPDVKDVKVSEYVLIEPGMWTTAFKLGDERYWKTDEDQLICASDVPRKSYY